VSFTVVPSVITGQQYTASEHNTYARSSMSALWVYTTAGDIAYATGSADITRLPNTANGVLIGGASAPSWLSIGATGRRLGVSAGAPAWTNDSIPGIFSAAGDMMYGTGVGTGARLAKPSYSAANLTLFPGTSSYPFWTRRTISAWIQVVDDSTDVDLDSFGYFFVPSILNTFSLYSVQPYFSTASSDQTSFNAVNLTAYPSNPMFDDYFYVEAGEVTCSPYTTSAYNVVATNDKLRIYLTNGSAGRGNAKGLWFNLIFTR